MKIEFPALHSEPLIYFLVHSGVFVLVMGLIFFLLGLWFGGLVWGRYKRKSRALHTENEALREEIATLKRKLAEQSMRPTSAPLELPKILTEQLPSVSEIFPERVSETYPALAALPPPEETGPLVAEVPLILENPAPEPHAELTLPPVPELNPPEPLAPKAKVTVRAKAKKTHILSSLPEAPPALESAVTEEAPLEPFGFLIAEPTELAASAKTLTAIIRGSAATAATAPEPKPSVEQYPAPAKTQPVRDPDLGLIFHEPPAQADDLTQIKGISTVLEKRLHELGIYTYQQIASWEERHIREISSRLAFKDRITREKWVEQAHALKETAPE
jgi:predicted flap endonuclease-1-like 5' DNA nuclease